MERKLDHRYYIKFGSNMGNTGGIDPVETHGLPDSLWPGLPIEIDIKVLPNGLDVYVQGKQIRCVCGSLVRSV